LERVAISDRRFGRGGIEAVLIAVGDWEGIAWSRRLVFELEGLNSQEEACGEVQQVF
jgi:hypothetical protein